MIADLAPARLAQSVERKALNLVVVGSSPTVGAFILVTFIIHAHLWDFCRCMFLEWVFG